MAARRQTYRIDAYRVLEVPPQATDAEIKASYRSLSKRYRQHLNLGTDEVLRELAEEKVKDINEAYDILKNDEKRREYDDHLRQREPARPILSRTHVNFGTLRPGERRAAKIVVSNAGGPANSTEVNASTDEWFTVEVEPEPGKDACWFTLRIVAHASSTTSLGKRDESIEVSFDGNTVQASVTALVAPREAEPSSTAPKAAKAKMHSSATRGASAGSVPPSAASPTASPPPPPPAGRPTAATSGGATSTGTGAGWALGLGLLLVAGVLAATFESSASDSRKAAEAASAAQAAANRIRSDEASRLIERTRVANGVVGEWSYTAGASPTTLTISKAGDALSAELRTDRVSENLRVELLPDNQLYLVNTRQHGKIVQPGDWWVGDFSQESWVELGRDGRSLIARFEMRRHGRTVTLNRTAAATAVDSVRPATTIAESLPGRGVSPGITPPTATGALPPNVGAATGAARPDPPPSAADDARRLSATRAADLDRLDRTVHLSLSRGDSSRILVSPTAYTDAGESLRSALQAIDDYEHTYGSAPTTAGWRRLTRERLNSVVGWCQGDNAARATLREPPVPCPLISP